MSITPFSGSYTANDVKFLLKPVTISILRDAGIDQNALRYILQDHAPETLVFAGGWTAKGVIAGQLASSLEAFAISDGVCIPAESDRVDIIWQKVLPQHQNPIELNFQQLQTISQQFLQWISKCYGITHHNYIKPGIGEATRVLYYAVKRGSCCYRI
ncbi:MAG: cysteine protease StiP domain-containing protein [Gammaproteobacteria bacterium]